MLALYAHIIPALDKEQEQPRVLTMNKDQRVKLLSRVDIFESLSKEEIKDLSWALFQRNTEISLEAGEVFYTPQQPDGKLFILIEGRVRIYKMEGATEYSPECLESVFSATLGFR